MSSGEYGKDGEGRLLAGRYRVVRQLGRGGMGTVSQAVDEVLGREVAVKELRTYSDSSGPELADLRLRMQREARAAARIRHPGVIAVHDIADDEGRPLIVMELVDGPSLDDVLTERGVLDPREAAAIGAKVMDALDAAHRAGVLHRDVKPANVLLDRSGRVVLTDFGIATMEEPGDGASTRLTNSGDIVGSLDYLAPERARGQEPGPAADVWSLGATLYAAVEGSSPFRRTSAWSTLTAIVTDPLPEPQRAGPLAPVLRELMAKDPAARPDAQRARELLEAVAAGRADESAGRAPGAADTTRLGTGPRRTRPSPTAPDNLGFGPAPELHGQVSPVQPSSGQPSPGRPSPGRPEPLQPPASQAVPVTHPAGPAADGPLVTGGSDRRSEGRRSGRLAVAAVGAALLLATAGTTVAMMIGSGSGTSDGAAADRVSSSPAGTTDGKRDGSKAAGEKAERSTSPAPSRKASAPPDEKPAGGDGTTTTGGGDSGDEGDGSGPDDGGTSGEQGGGSTSTGGGDGGGGATGGGESTPAPVCHGIGDGKYNCTVWRTADSYDSSGTKVGKLNAGTNYFYCQTKGRRETYGQWTNTWWAKTDDDSGYTGVLVSDVYIKGGDNDQPVPGLPVC
ncbi:protein kinase domain-containing protein [Streptomyces sp. 8N706]|uniref:protein kinase domain-containing protein n=1 Tax=Streptomyces sp. 8N706 TaxID=3457416 RepID=UPI003FD380F3